MQFTAFTFNLPYFGIVLKYGRFFLKPAIDCIVAHGISAILQELAFINIAATLLLLPIIKTLISKSMKSIQRKEACDCWLG